MSRAGRLARLALVPAIALLLEVPPVRACMCVPPDSPLAEMTASAAVFVGVVISQEGPHRIPAGEDAFTLSHRTFRFNVIAAWKGVSGPEASVRTGSGGGDCGYDFRVGETYLVYASQWRDTLGTSICTRTTPLSQARVDLAELPVPVVDRRKSRSSWE